MITEDDISILETVFDSHIHKFDLTPADASKTLDRVKVSNYPISANLADDDAWQPNDLEAVSQASDMDECEFGIGDAGLANLDDKLISVAVVKSKGDFVVLGLKSELDGRIIAQLEFEDASVANNKKTRCCAYVKGSYVLVEFMYMLDRKERHRYVSFVWNGGILKLLQNIVTEPRGKIRRGEDGRVVSWRHIFIFLNFKPKSDRSREVIVIEFLDAKTGEVDFYSPDEDERISYVEMKIESNYLHMLMGSMDDKFDWLEIRDLSKKKRIGIHYFHPGDISDDYRLYRIDGNYAMVVNCEIEDQVPGNTVDYRVTIMNKEFAIIADEMFRVTDDTIFDMISLFKKQGTSFTVLYQTPLESDQGGMIKLNVFCILRGHFIVKYICLPLPSVPLEQVFQKDQCLQEIVIRLDIDNYLGNQHIYGAVLLKSYQVNEECVDIYIEANGYQFKYRVYF